MNMRESIITRLKEMHYTGCVLDTVPHTCASPDTQISRHNDAVSFKKYFIFSMFLLLKFLFGYFLFSTIVLVISFKFKTHLFFLSLFLCFYSIFSMLAYCFHVYVYSDQFCSNPMILRIKS